MGNNISPPYKGLNVKICEKKLAFFELAQSVSMQTSFLNSTSLITIARRFNVLGVPTFTFLFSCNWKWRGLHSPNRREFVNFCHHSSILDTPKQNVYILNVVTSITIISRRKQHHLLGGRKNISIFKICRK